MGSCCLRVICKGGEEGVIGGAGLGRRAYLVLFKTFNTFLDFQGVTVRPDSCLPGKSKVVIN